MIDVSETINIPGAVVVEVVSSGVPSVVCDTVVVVVPSVEGVSTAAVPVDSMLVSSFDSGLEVFDVSSGAFSDSDSPEDSLMGVSVTVVDESVLRVEIRKRINKER